MFRHLKALLQWKNASPRARRYRLFCLVCVLLIAFCIAYVAYWYIDQGRIEAEGASYGAMYSPAPLTTAAPSPFANETATAVPTASPSPAPTSTPSAAPTPSISPNATATPTARQTVPPTLPPVAVRAASPAPLPTATPQPRVVDETRAPLATPDENTLIYALPTPPPPQESFSELLLYNPDTVGYLMIGDIVDLPVVQRENDNEYYLTHAFSGAEAREGALFLDGANRLGDENLIVYGHNMRNGTMFGQLSSFGEREFLLENAVVRFDTLYENALYVPFAMFEASMDAEDGHYFDVRQIVFDETSYELFVLKLRARSTLEIPVEVSYGDQLLTLVTCSYNDDDGRYIVALRKLRAGETEEEMRALMESVE